MPRLLSIFIILFAALQMRLKYTCICIYIANQKWGHHLLGFYCVCHDEIATQYSLARSNRVLLIDLYSAVLFVRCILMLMSFNKIQTFFHIYLVYTILYSSRDEKKYKKNAPYVWHFSHLNPHTTGGALAAIKSSFIQITIIKTCCCCCCCYCCYCCVRSQSFHFMLFHFI